eukprot:365417-Chlamydomonas_euryale.AAC.14
MGGTLVHRSAAACQQPHVTHRCRFMCTASTDVVKWMSWMVRPDDVLRTLMRRGLSAGCSPVPTNATMLEQNSISTMLCG